MGFFHRDAVADDVPRWVDEADLGWTPEEPLTSEPHGEPPVSSEARTPLAEAPARRDRPALFLLPRIAIGLAQGLGLYLLSAAHGGPVAALSLPLLLAPLILLEGLGEIPLRLLLPWTALAAIGLGALGAAHQARLAGADGLILVLMAGAALFIVQTLLRAGVKGRLADYTSLFHSGWTLAARLLLWAAVTGLAWALTGSGNSLFNWLRAHQPGLVPNADPELFALPLVAMASALAFAVPGAISRFLRKAMLACWTVALPMLAAAAVLILFSHVLSAPIPAVWLLSFALLLLIALNASYRGTARRGAWRKASEFAATFLIAALAASAAIALALRVLALGWTDIRILAAAATTALGLYGLLYCGAALIALGGGRFLQRIEFVNLALAPPLVLALLALASPFADPMTLAVKAQTLRLAQVDPARFDFAWLARSQPGRSALAQMVRDPAPEIARAATTALAGPARETPPPSEIGANIAVRTPGAHLPAGLIGHDWSKDAARVPACLTRPAAACDAWFLDLDRDGAPEVLLVSGDDVRWWASVMKQTPSGWVAAASFASPPCRGTLTAMRRGALYAVEPAPAWQDLFVAGFRLTAKPAPKPDLPCPR